MKSNRILKRIICSTIVMSVIMASFSLITFAESKGEKNNRGSRKEVISDEGLLTIANMSIDDCIELLSENGYDPSKIFTEEEVAMARLQTRAGVTKLKKVNKTTRDLYLNSYIATTLKYIPVAVVAAKYGISGVIIGGVIAEHIKTSKGVIVRFKKEKGYLHGTNGYVWTMKSVRSQ